MNQSQLSRTNQQGSKEIGEDLRLIKSVAISRAAQVPKVPSLDAPIMHDLPMTLRTWLDSSDDDYGMLPINSSEASLPIATSDTTPLVAESRIRIEEVEEDSQQFERFVMHISRDINPASGRIVDSP